jgi:Bacterial Ig domain
MALGWFLVVTLLSSLFLHLTAAKAQTLDQYGGYASLPVPGGATGSFRVGKIGNRWVLATPSGNAFWMRAVYATNIDDHVDDRGSTYHTRVIAKYGDADLTWGPAQNRRLLAWGFNAHAEYASGYVLPWTTIGDPRWPTSTQPVKVPAVPFPIQASSYSLRNVFGYATQPVKQLYYPLANDGAYLSYGGYVGSFADVFDPNFTQWIAGRLASSDFATYAASPYLLGFSSDDGDYTTGLGAGKDFVPSQSNSHPHLGYVVAITAPTQAAATIQGQSITYTDTNVYSKLAWRDFLVARYGSIGLLNTAWGTSDFYTSFNSTGTWGIGTGLLDEDGRHTWMGTDPFGLTGSAAAVRTDLDDFLYQIAHQYFSAYRTQIRAKYPNVLFFGPTTVGAWNAPARRQVLQAAGQSLDLMRISWDGSQAQLDFNALYAGDLPFAVWLGAVANPDSALWRYTQGGQADVFTTQSGRAEFYTSSLSSMLTMTAASTGAKPFVGLQLWQYTDNWAEKSNWGMVTLSDNAYDGNEAIITEGTDQWGYHTGGEERNYGNFLGPVSSANAGVGQALWDSGGGGTTMSVSITAPTSGSTVQNDVTVSVSASIGTSMIHLLLDGNVMGIVSGSSANYPWDTTATSDGIHEWVAKAYDASGIYATSVPTSVVVKNQSSVDASPPVAAMLQPTGATSIGRRSRVNVAITASDDVGVARVEFYVNGGLMCTFAASPYTCAWRVPAAAGKTYSLQAKAYDAAGNVGVSGVVSVTVAK